MNDRHRGLMDDATSARALIAYYLGWESGQGFEGACRRASTETLTQTLRILDEPTDPNDSERNRMLYAFGQRVIREVLAERE